MNKLFSDLKTDEEKSNFFLSGRGYETGVIAPAIQNDVAMAYHRCVEYEKEVQALRKDAERYRWLREQHEKPVGGLTICEAGTWDLKPWSGDDPDTAIDARMDKQK